MPTMQAYSVKRTPRSEFIPIRHMHYHVLVWGDPHAKNELPPLVLMHGWMDVAASYQFMVDAFGETFMANRLVIAADWRGFGLTKGAPTDNYWFPDYLADLDALLDHFSPDKPVDLLGHSMGGNVVMLYAGSRPERIHKLINLEGFGSPDNAPEQAPKRYAKWLDDIKSLHRGEKNLTAYNSVDGVARRLMKTNPRLARDEAGMAKAHWLARHWAAEQMTGLDAGKWLILGDPAHKLISAYLYRAAETMAIYRSIEAPILMVEASDDSLSQWWDGKYTLADFHERIKLVKNCTTHVIPDTSHMLHHDKPEELARLIEKFLLT